MVDDRPTRTSTALLALVASLASAIAGVAVAMVWHYAVPRQLFDADPPPAGDPDDTGYFRIPDYTQHISGPDWWPTSWITPLVSLTLGAAVAVLLWWISTVRSHPVKSALFIVAPVLSGSVVGGVLAWRYTEHPPGMFVRFVVDPFFDDFGPTGLPREEVYCAPPFFDIANATVLLPTMGAALGAAAFCGGLVVLALIRRARRGQGQQ